MRPDKTSMLTDATTKLYFYDFAANYTIPKFKDITAKFMKKGKGESPITCFS